MKKILLLVFLVGIVYAISWSAAPAYNEYAANYGASITIDSAHDATMWELIDSIIVVKTDTCYTIYTLSGVAVLDYEDKLYLGFDDGGGAEGAPLDTMIIEGKFDNNAPARIPFSVRYIDSLISQTDANDTIYVYAAVAGTAGSQKVNIEHGFFTAEVIDMNAAGVIGE